MEKITLHPPRKFSVISASKICRGPAVTNLESRSSRRLAAENAETSPDPIQSHSDQPPGYWWTPWKFFFPQDDFLPARARLLPPAYRSGREVSCF